MCDHTSIHYYNSLYSYVYSETQCLYIMMNDIHLRVFEFGAHAYTVDIGVTSCFSAGGLLENLVETVQCIHPVVQLTLYGT